MPNQPVLEASPRAILGKQVKNLRRDGLLPANVYGRGIDSLAIQTDAKEFGRFIHGDGIRGVFQLKVAGEKKPRSVILRSLSRAGGTGDPIHADFLQVQSDRPVEFTVPLRFVGESPAVRDLAGTLVQILATARIRSLPGNIPEALDVELSLLKGYSQTITMGDIALPKGVQLLNKPHLVIVTVNPPRAARGQ